MAYASDYYPNNNHISLIRMKTQLILSWSSVLLLLGGMLFLPEAVLAGRVGDIASAISGGNTNEKLHQLTMIGLYGGALILLLVLINLAQQKKGAKRLVALVLLLLFGTSFLILHLA